MGRGGGGSDPFLPRSDTTWRGGVGREGRRFCVMSPGAHNPSYASVKRGFKNKTKEIMLPLYKSMVRPHLDYCKQAWKPHLKKDIDKLEKVQRRATKMIEGLAVA